MPATLSKNLKITPGDKLFPVAKGVEMLTGNRPHPTTTSRWCRRGTSGVVLPSLIISGRRMTSLVALEKWFRDVTERRNAV